jgi:transcriptional regulator GlxA family with amidase domain
MAKITFMVCDGCMFSGVSGLIDSFLIANTWHNGPPGSGDPPLFETEILSPDGKSVNVAGGLTVTPDGRLDDGGMSDMIIVPPFLPNADLHGKTAGDVFEWIHDRHHRGTEIAALCTGTFVLAETGLLEGRLATTNWIYARVFRERYPRVNLKPERMMTRDAGLICTGNVSAFYNLALYMIETFGNRTLSTLCAKSLLVDVRRTTQSSYIVFNAYRGHGDRGILKAQDYMESHLTENISMEDLARHVGISPRQFIRRFKKATGESPLNYLQLMRIEKAKTLLETGDVTVEEITQAIGYENSSTFRKLFKSSTGISAREYRERFAQGKLTGQKR